MNAIERAHKLINDFKGNSYLYGESVLGKLGEFIKPCGTKAVLIADTFEKSGQFIDQIKESLNQSGIRILAQDNGARPNAPREDVYRMVDLIGSAKPDVIVSFGGGSTIDSVKAAEVLNTLGGDFEAYFGVGLVSKKLEETGKSLNPHVAIQSISSSAAHLTKYSNITDLTTNQKKLIVDTAVVPPMAVFDFAVTYGAPAGLTSDGALDGISHMLEVLFSAAGKETYPKCLEIAETGIDLIVENLPLAIMEPDHSQARIGLCLATDLGGYAIMVGGTNGAHLTSFSLVDILSHGRACALMNPYYAVFFAPAVEEPLRRLGQIYRKHGYSDSNFLKLKGRDLGMAFAEAMFAFAKKIHFPVKLSDIEGFSQQHIERALAAAKNPQLQSKLENMPVPLTADMIDDYMAPILEAAKSGDVSLIRNV